MGAACRTWSAVLVSLTLAGATALGRTAARPPVADPVDCRAKVAGESRVTLAAPYGVAVMAGGILIADAGSGCVLHVSRRKVTSVIAGNGKAGYSGDGGPALAAQLTFPTGAAPTRDGGFLIADNGNNRIRRVRPSGRINTVAGDGSPGFSGDGGRAIDAELAFPSAIARVRGGGYLIADNGNNRIRQVLPSRKITTVAGVGMGGFSGDEGPATLAQLNAPTGVTTFGGGFLIADSKNHRIRRVFPSKRIATVAGSGSRGFSGDAKQATLAQLDTPTSVVRTPGGGFLIADSGNNRVREVTPRGVIRTVAGRGSAEYSGDGGPATEAALATPTGVAAEPGGGFLIADSGNNRVRRVSATGVITTLAGEGEPQSENPRLRSKVLAETFPSLSEWSFYLPVHPIVAKRRPRVRVPVYSTRDARVRVLIRKSGRRVRGPKRKRINAGWVSIRLRGLRPGRYAVRVRGSSRGERERDRARLRVRK